MPTQDRRGRKLKSDEAFLYRQTRFGVLLRKHLRDAGHGASTQVAADARIRNDLLSGFSTGRLATPSPKTIARIAQALDLTDTERQALFMAAALDHGYELTGYLPDFWSAAQSGQYVPSEREGETSLRYPRGKPLEKSHLAL